MAPGKLLIVGLLCLGGVEASMLHRARRLLDSNVNEDVTDTQQVEVSEGSAAAFMPEPLAVADLPGEGEGVFKLHHATQAPPRPSDNQIVTMLSSNPQCTNVMGDYRDFLAGKPDDDPTLQAPASHCHTFSQRKAWIDGFRVRRPDAPFEVGYNNYSDFTDDEFKLLLGIKNPFIDLQNAIDVVNGNLASLVDMNKINLSFAGGPPHPFNATVAGANLGAGGGIKLPQTETNTTGGGAGMFGGFKLPQTQTPQQQQQQASSLLPGLAGGEGTGGGVNNGTRYDRLTRRLVTLPKAIDYRFPAQNPYGVVAVTNVKAQGLCGCCWAFSAAGVLEGQVAITFGSTKSVSPQHLLDCSGSDMSCDGGQVDGALGVIKTRGAVALTDYPYSAAKGSCKASTSIYASAQGPQYITPCDETQLMEALYYFGPISIYVNAYCSSFQNYKSGILDEDCITGDPDTNACQRVVDHAVLLVGYGTDTRTGLNYWLIKNQWGTSWGEMGFARIKRGVGKCGLGCMMSFPMTSVKAVKGQVAGNDDGSTQSTDNSVAARLKAAFTGRNGGIYIALFVLTGVGLLGGIFLLCYRKKTTSSPLIQKHDNRRHQASV